MLESSGSWLHFQRVLEQYWNLSLEFQKSGLSTTYSGAYVKRFHVYSTFRKEMGYKNFVVVLGQVLNY